MIGAAIAGHPNSVTVRVVEAALGGLFDCVLSDSIREETTEVLLGFGWSLDQINELFGPLWDIATFVPLGDDDPGLVKVVNDPDDVHVLRCGLGVFMHALELAEREHKFLISENTKHFKAGVNWMGFQFVTANEFWTKLRKTDPAA